MNFRIHAYPVFLGLALLCLTFLAPLPASAQDFLDEFDVQDMYTDETGEEKAPSVVNQYDKQYLQSSKPVEVSRGLLPSAHYLIRFVRTADAKPDQAVLRISSPVAITGCANIEQPGVTIQQNGQLILIMVGEPLLNLRTDVRYAHFQCDMSNQTASADIVLDRAQMMADNVATILLQAGQFTDYFDVETTEDTLTLKPKSANAKIQAFNPYFKPGASEPLIYHSYPDNLMVLEVPSAKPGQKVAGTLAQLARSKGLANGKALPAYLQGEAGQKGQKYYFMDTRRQYAGKIAFGKPDFFGTVTVGETLRGPQGPYEVPQVLDVYIKRPGEFD